MESYLTAEISASAIRTNISLLRRRLQSGARLCAVVKADCYGHGQKLLLELLSREADCLAVATPGEAIGLRSMGYGGPLLVFFSACAFADAGERAAALEELIAGGVTLTLAAHADVAALAEAAGRVGIQAKLHIKIDTGMSRSGVLPEAAAGLAAEVRGRPELRLSGLYTHFAVAEEPDKEFTRLQLGRFLSAVEACGGRSGLVIHSANSAATIDLPETHLDMARCGLAVYGYQPSDRMLTKLPLAPAMRLVGRLMQVKSVPAGSRCGYGLRHTFARASRIGLVPIGYGDGYMRCLSNRTSMRVRGQLVPACGTISMDQIVVDLTDLPSAAPGDEVEIISADPAAPNSVENLARLAGTIPYEVTCRLGQRVRRKLVEGGNVAAGSRT